MTLGGTRVPKMHTGMETELVDAPNGNLAAASGGSYTVSIKI